MLIIPVSRRPDWRHPPVVTLLLILINCLIYFGLQVSDEKRQENAYRFYASSTLPGVELPRYVKQLELSGRGHEAKAAADALGEENWPQVLMAMQADAPFMKRLRSGNIILSEDADYADWKRQRDEFDRLYRSSI